MARHPFALSMLLLLMPSCMVGPTYRHPPEVSASASWIEAASGGDVDERWWERFGDPQLTALIAAAEAGNSDLRVALARVMQARATRDAAAGARLPQVDLAGSVSTNRLSKNGELPIGQIPGVSPNFNLYDVGLDASWEIDFWGHTARTIEAAGDRLQASEADRRAVLLDLRAEVARNYIDLRAAQARLASVQTDAEAQTRIAALTRQRFDAGEVSRFDNDRAEGQARTTAAQVPGIEADIRALAYRLAELVGKPPEALVDVLLKRLPIPQAPGGIAMGLRSDLLRRRPDIVAAERRIAAATADVGVATSELFPRISLTGTIGQQAQTPGDLVSAASTRFGFGPTLQWPIFDAGRIRAQIRGAKAGADAAAAQYVTAVLGALTDSETSANRFIRARETLQDVAAAEASQRSALNLAQQRYEAGDADLLELLQAQSAHATAEHALTDAQAQVADQAIALYKALGGGA